MEFLTGLLSGILIGYFIACILYMAKECDDREEKIEKEEDNKE